MGEPVTLNTSPEKGFLQETLFLDFKTKKRFADKLYKVYNSHGTPENKSDYWETATKGTVEMEVNQGVV